jgi:hypothetical protein
MNLIEMIQKIFFVNFKKGIVLFVVTKICKQIIEIFVYK